jgi:hypothetical protein
MISIRFSRTERRAVDQRFSTNQPEDADVRLLLPTQCEWIHPSLFFASAFSFSGALGHTHFVVTFR